MYRFGCVELKINLCPIQAPATKPSGCAGEFRYFVEEEVKKKQLVRIHVFKKKALKQARSACLRAH
jgi:hypothetical protein